MCHAPFDVDASKRPTNLSLNRDLVRCARELGINVSAELEQRLAELVHERAGAGWEERNRRAITEYNERVTTQRVFSDRLRRF